MQPSMVGISEKCFKTQRTTLYKTPCQNSVTSLPCIILSDYRNNGPQKLVSPTPQQHNKNKQTKQKTPGRKGPGQPEKELLRERSPLVSLAESTWAGLLSSTPSWRWTWGSLEPLVALLNVLTQNTPPFPLFTGL